MQRENWRSYQAAWRPTWQRVGTGVLGASAMSTIVVSDFGTQSQNSQVQAILDSPKSLRLPHVGKQKLASWAIEPDQSPGVYSGVLRQVQKVGNPAVERVARS